MCGAQQIYFEKIKLFNMSSGDLDSDWCSFYNSAEDVHDLVCGESIFESGHYGIEAFNKDN